MHVKLIIMKRVTTFVRLLHLPHATFEISLGQFWCDRTLPSSLHLAMWVTMGTLQNQLFCQTWRGCKENLVGFKLKSPSSSWLLPCPRFQSLQMVSPSFFASIQRGILTLLFGGELVVVLLLGIVFLLMQ